MKTFFSFLVNVYPQVSSASWYEIKHMKYICQSCVKGN